MPRRSAELPREAILDAAREVLATEGLEAMTVRRIAAESGGSTMTVYSCFGGKDGVIDALVIEGFEQLTGAMRRVRSTSDPLADLERCSRAYRAFALTHRTHYDLMFTDPARGYRKSTAAIDASHAALDTIVERVTRAMDAGVIRRGDPLEIATVFWCANHGPVSLELKQVGPPTTKWEDVHRLLFEAMVAGLHSTSETRT